MPEIYDIIVAGGGPAGLSAAKTASSGGVNVLLLELQAQIGGQTQSCSWIPSKVLDERLRKSIVNTVQNVTLHSPNHELSITGEFGAIVDRRSFDKILALEAAEKGVEIWVGSPVKELLEERNRICGVRSEAGEWSEDVYGDVIIDATGTSGKWSSIFLRKVKKRDWNKEKMTRSNEYLMANARNGGVDIYFSSYFAPLAHAWIYPFGEGFVMAGIRGARIHPDAALDEFIGHERPARLENSTPIAAFRGQLSVEGPLEPTCVDGMLTVGSAAGQTFPLSGFGLRYALEAGGMAGEVAAKAVEEGDTSKEKLMEYDQRWRESFKKELKMGSNLQMDLQMSPDRKMDALFEAIEDSPELQRKFIKVLSAQNPKENLKGLFKKEKARYVFESTAKSLSPHSEM